MLIGDVVIYRNRDGVDMAALVTDLLNDGAAHLHLFPQPAASRDILSHEWGSPRHEGDGEPRPGTWRPRDRPLPPGVEVVEAG